MGSWPFMFEIGMAAAKAAWSDLGTNGLGWIVGLSAPFLVVLMKIRGIDRGTRITFVSSRWKSELRDVALVFVAVWLVIALWEGIWSIPHQIINEADRSRLPERAWPSIPIPSLQYLVVNLPASAPSHQSPSPLGIVLNATIVDPKSPAIIVENLSERSAVGVLWQTIIFRESDLTYISFASQTLGYVKPHDTTAKYPMFSPNVARISDGDGQMKDGESFTGTLSVDCPDCEGATYIVHFDWGIGGWMYQRKDMKGKLAMPKNMEKEGRASYILLLKQLSLSQKKVAIIEKNP